MEARRGKIRFEHVPPSEKRAVARREAQGRTQGERSRTQGGCGGFQGRRRAHAQQRVARGPTAVASGRAQARGDTARRERARARREGAHACSEEAPDGQAEARALGPTASRPSRQPSPASFWSTGSTGVSADSKFHCRSRTRAGSTSRRQPGNSGHASWRVHSCQGAAVARKPRGCFCRAPCLTREEGHLRATLHHRAPAPRNSPQYMQRRSARQLRLSPKQACNSPHAQPPSLPEGRTPTSQSHLLPRYLEAWGSTSVGRDSNASALDFPESGGPVASEREDEASTAASRGHRHYQDYKLPARSQLTLASGYPRHSI
jgi:hypothetical protein